MARGNFRPMRLLLLVPALTLTLPLIAAPVNDNFAARTSLAGSLQTIVAHSIDATVEADENTQNGYFGATVWWSWISPVTGWARVDTKGSSFDTVLQISTGTTLATQTYLGFNHLSPDPALVKSSVTFPVTAGTTYNIAVGGCELCDSNNGDITLHIATGTEATPAFFPVTLTLSPPLVDVTGGDASVTAAFTIQAASGSGTGRAGIGFGWENNAGYESYTGNPAAWDTCLPQSGSPRVVFPVSRYTAPGTRKLWFKISSRGNPGELIFSPPDGGSGYALPPSATQSLQVTNTGETDELPPELTQFSITPDNVDVTTAPASLQVSATLTDAPAGVASVRVKLITSGFPFVAALTRTAGTPQRGTWTGAIAVPLLYPTGNYSVLVEASDPALNDTAYGHTGSREIPGGSLYVPIIGGSAYEQWAYTSWFQPDDSLPGLLDDADGDGKLNLLSYAFDLNPLAIAASSGTFPGVALNGTGATRRLRITYLRRRASTGSGLTYSPQFTSSLTGVWQSVNGGSVTSLNGTWERVVVDDPVSVAGDTRRFGRVKVEYAAP